MVVRTGRSTKTRQRTRRAHFGVTHAALSKCPKCGKSVLPHTICNYCGFYKGRQVIDVLKKLEKKERKKKEKELEQAQAEQEAAKPLDPKSLSKKDPKKEPKGGKKVKEHGHEDLNPGDKTGEPPQDR